MPTSAMIKYLTFLLCAISALSEARPLPCPILNEKLGSIVCCEETSQGPLKRCTEHLPISSFKALKVWSQTTIDLANDLLRRAQSKNDGLKKIVTENVGDDSNRRRQLEIDAKNIIGDLKNFPKKCCCEERKQMVTLSEGYSYEQDVKYKIYQELPLMGQAVMQSTCPKDSCAKNGVKYSCVQVHTFVPQYVIDDKFAQYLQKVPIRINKGCICKIENDDKSNWKKIFIRSADKIPQKREANVNKFAPEDENTLPNPENHLERRDKTPLQNVLNVFKKVKINLDMAYSTFLAKLKSLNKGSVPQSNVDNFINNFHDAASLIHIATKLIKVNVSSQDELFQTNEESTSPGHASDWKADGFTSIGPKLPETTSVKHGTNLPEVSRVYTMTKGSKLSVLNYRKSPDPGKVSIKTTTEQDSMPVHYYSTTTHSSPTIREINSEPLNNYSSLADNLSSPLRENDINDESFNLFLSSGRTPLELSTSTLSKSFTTSNEPAALETTTYTSAREASRLELYINEATKDAKNVTEVTFDEKARTEAFVDAGHKYTLPTQALNVTISSFDYSEKSTTDDKFLAETLETMSTDVSSNTFLSGQTASDETTGFDQSKSENYPANPDTTKALTGLHENIVTTSTPSEIGNSGSKVDTTSADTASTELLTEAASVDMIDFEAAQTVTKIPLTITSRDWQKLKVPSQALGSSVIEDSTVASTLSLDVTECAITKSVALSSTKLAGKESFEASVETTDMTAEMTNSISLDWVTDEVNAQRERCSSKTLTQVNTESFDGTNAALKELSFTIAPIKPSIETTSHTNRVSTKVDDFTSNELFTNSLNVLKTVSIEDGKIYTEKSSSFKTEGVDILNSMGNILDESVQSTEGAISSFANERVYSSSFNSAPLKNINQMNMTEYSSTNANKTDPQNIEALNDVDRVEGTGSTPKDSNEGNERKFIDTIGNTTPIIEGGNVASYSGAKYSKRLSVAKKEKKHSTKTTLEVAITPQTTSETLVNIDITMDLSSKSRVEMATARSNTKSKLLTDDGLTSTVYSEEGGSTNTIGATTLDMADKYTSTTPSSQTTFWRKPLLKKARKNCEILCSKKKNRDHCSFCNCCSDRSVSPSLSTGEKLDFITKVEDLYSFASSTPPMQTGTSTYIEYSTQNLDDKKELIDEIKVVHNSEIKPLNYPHSNRNVSPKSSQKTVNIDKAIEELVRHASRIILKELGVPQNQPCEVPSRSLNLFHDLGVSPFTLYTIENLLCSAFHNCIPIDSHKLSLITATSERLLRSLQTPISHLTKAIRDLLLSLEMSKMMSYSGAVMKGDYSSIQPDDQALYKLLFEKVKGIYVMGTHESCETKDSAFGTKVFQYQTLGAKERVKVEMAKDYKGQSIYKSTHDQIQRELNHATLFLSKQPTETKIQNHLPIQSSVPPFFHSTSLADGVETGLPTQPETIVLEGYDNQATNSKVVDLGSTTQEPPLIHPLPPSNMMSAEDKKYVAPTDVIKGSKPDNEYVSNTATEEGRFDTLKLSPKSNRYNEMALSTEGGKIMSLTSVAEHKTTIKKENLPEPVSFVTEATTTHYANSSGEGTNTKGADSTMVSHTNAKKIQEHTIIPALKEISKTAAMKLSEGDANDALLMKIPLNSSVPSRLAINSSQDTIYISKDHLERAIQNRKKYHVN